MKINPIDESQVKTSFENFLVLPKLRPLSEKTDKSRTKSGEIDGNSLHLNPHLSKSPNHNLPCRVADRKVVHTGTESIAQQPIVRSANPNPDNSVSTMEMKTFSSILSMKKTSFEERKKKFEKVTSKEIPRVRKVIDLEKIISGKRKKTNYENSPNSKKNRVGRADYGH